MKLRAALRISSLPLLLSAAATVSFPQERPPLTGKQYAGTGAYAAAGYSYGTSLRGRASELAASTADAAAGWDDRRLAVRVLTEAADLLWVDDPTRARSWLSQAWELAGRLDDETDDTAVARFRSNSPKARGRALVLAVAQRRDRALAERLLEQLADEEHQVGRESRRAIFDDKTARSEQLLDLALAVVKSDPKAAAGLAELSLADGISFRVQSVLLALRDNDRGAADHLLDAALRRWAGRPDELSDAQVIASYLFTPGRVVGVGGDNVAAMAVSSRKPADGRTPAEADPARARRFLHITQRNLLSSPAPSATATPALRAQEVVSLAVTLEPAFRLYAPELWTAVAQRMVAVLPDLAPPPEGRLPEPVRRRLESGDTASAGRAELNRLYVDGLEEAAEKEPDPAARKFAYLRAAMATSPDDLPRGLSLAAKISEDELRKRVSSSLAYRAALSAVEKGRLGEATELAPKLEPLQQALVSIAAAQRLGAHSGDADEAQGASRRARALELLADAERAIKKSGGSGDALRVRLGLVAALAPLDAPRALDLLRDVVTDVNQADSFDPADTSSPRVGVIYGSAAQAPTPVVRGGFGLKDAFSVLSKVDFGESVHIAGRLKAPHVRGVCMMEIARSILTGDGSAR